MAYEDDRLRIVTDGIPTNSRVFVGETELRLVEGVEWSLTFDGGSRAKVTFFDPIIEFVPRKAATVSSEPLESRS